MFPSSLAFAAITIQAAETAQTPAPGDGLQSSLTQAAIAVAFLIGVIGLCAYGFKKLMSKTLVARAERRSLSLVDVLPLGGKQKVCVLRCYDRTFLVGVGERDVTTLAELDSAIGAKAAPLVTEPDEQEAFLEVLSAQQRKALLARAQDEVARRERDHRATLLAAVHSSEEDGILERRPRRQAVAQEATSSERALPDGVQYLQPEAPAPAKSVKPAKRKRPTLKKRSAQSSTAAEIDALTVRRVVPRTVAQDEAARVPAKPVRSAAKQQLGGGLIA